MTPKTVLDVGNCGPDHSAISAMLRKHFDVEILRSDQWSDTLAILERQPVDLILINRKLDIDYSDGMEILRQIKRSEALHKRVDHGVFGYPQAHAGLLDAIAGYLKKMKQVIAM